MDWGHEERDYAAGHGDRAPRLSPGRWQGMVEHVKQIAQLAWREYGIRAVVHPHAGGYIEFADEIDQIVEDIPCETAGLCLGTGHLYYAGMDPETWLRRHAGRIDYVHFKDTRRGCSRPGPTCTTASPRRWTRATGATRRRCRPSATPTSTPGWKGCAGWRTACARPSRARCGWRCKV